MNSKTMQFRRGVAPFLALAAALFCSAASAASQAATQPAAPTLLAKFEQPFSTKSARQGDPVSAKTLRELKLPNLDIPKGSRILGVMTAAQSKKDGNGNSSLAIHFDRVEMKDGRVLPIAGLIVAMGQVDNDPGLGSFSVLGRGGVGSDVGLDPNVAVQKSAQDDIPAGSSIQGIALGKSLDSGNASLLRGVGRDIDCDTNTEIKVALFRAAAH
jgi:hypothetical protein